MNPLLHWLLQSLQSAGQGAQQLTDISGRYARGQQQPGDLSQVLGGVLSFGPGATRKVFKPAPADYGQRLARAFEEYSSPEGLMKAKNRLQPALQLGPGDPQLGKNLMVGERAVGHGPLYEQLQGMPGSSMTHGYYDPLHEVFLGDALNTMLYDPQKLPIASRLLQQGIGVDSLIEALGYNR